MIPEKMEILSTIYGSSMGMIFLIDIGIQIVGWGFAVAFTTEKFYDLTGKLKQCSYEFMSGLPEITARNACHNSLTLFIDFFVALIIV